MFRTATKLIAAPALMATLLLGVGTARAEADFHHTGVACNPDNSARNDIGYSSNQGVWNESTTNNSAKVYCPIVTTFNPTNFTTASFDLFFYDKSSAGDVTCTFYALRVDGDIVVSDPETSSGSSNTIQSFTWDAHEDVIEDATYFTVSCTIPKASSSSSSTRSGIVTYNFSQDPI
jgi:hypothetical protein